MTPTVRALLGLMLAGSIAGCEADALLGPAADQGIAGVALRGPICPVVSEDQADECADRPHQAWIGILDARGGRVTRIRTDPEGRFRVGLVPGRYTLVPEGGDPFPAASEQQVTVEPGVFTEVTVSFDTGIR